jgi:hypothetical protein
MEPAPVMPKMMSKQVLVLDSMNDFYMGLRRNSRRGPVNFIKRSDTKGFGSTIKKHPGKFLAVVIQARFLRDLKEKHIEAIGNTPTIVVVDRKPRKTHTSRSPLENCVYMHRKFGQKHLLDTILTLQATGGVMFGMN